MIKTKKILAAALMLLLVYRARLFGHKVVVKRRV